MKCPLCRGRGWHGWKGEEMCQQCQGEGTIPYESAKVTQASEPDPVACMHDWILVPPGDDYCTKCGTYR
jgi:DnaJ-class molecular chaperone